MRPEKTGTWANDQQKIIGMLRDKYQDWLSEVGNAYPDYLTDGGFTVLENLVRTISLPPKP